MSRKLRCLSLLSPLISTTAPRSLYRSYDSTQACNSLNSRSATKLASNPPEDALGALYSGWVADRAERVAGFSLSTFLYQYCM